MHNTNDEMLMNHCLLSKIVSVSNANEVYCSAAL